MGPGTPGPPCWALSSVASLAGCRRQQQLHTATAAAHSNSGCTQQQLLHTATAAAHGNSGCTRQQQLHTATAAAHGNSSCTRQQPLRTATAAAHGNSGPLLAPIGSSGFASAALLGHPGRGIVHTPPPSAHDSQKGRACDGIRQGRCCGDRHGMVFAEGKSYHCQLICNIASRLK